MLFKSLLVHPLIEKLEEKDVAAAMTAVRITNPSDLKMSRPGLILFWPF
jgi:hypothetical protein